MNSHIHDIVFVVSSMFGVLIGFMVGFCIGHDKGQGDE